MLKRGWVYAWGVMLFAGLPGRAWADVGTPLMWTELGHLVLGNLLIGIGEGILLAWLFRVAKGKAMGLMIAANYFSAWVGFVLLRGAIVRAVPMDLNNAWIWFWIMVGVAYLMTVVLEWPFVAGVMMGRAHWARDAWKASLVVLCGATGRVPVRESGHTVHQYGCGCAAGAGAAGGGAGVLHQ